MDNIHLTKKTTILLIDRIFDNVFLYKIIRRMKSGSADDKDDEKISRDLYNTAACTE